MSASLEQVALLARLLLTLANSDAKKRTRKFESDGLSDALKSAMAQQAKVDTANRDLLAYVTSSGQPVPIHIDPAELYESDESAAINAALLAALDKDSKIYQDLATKIIRRPTVKVFNDGAAENLFIQLTTALVTGIEQIQKQYAENLAHCREESFKGASSLGGIVSNSDSAK
jgi:hypothetical protein